MENVTPGQAKVNELVAFICNRRATDEEFEAAERPSFKFERFRLELLAGEECLSRWPQILSVWSDFFHKERELADSTHKIAHDLSLLRRDLDKVQSNSDGLQQKILEVLRNAEAISRLAKTMKDVQAEILAISEKAAHLEHKLSDHLARDAE